MTPSINCINLIKKFEGFRSKPYKCPAGIPTIGYGSTFYLNGERVTMSDVAITEELATDILTHTVTDFAKTVSSLLHVPVSQNQFDALVSLSYNIGIHAFAQSTLLTMINKKEKAASDQFLRWDKAAGKVVKGLTIRRQMEKELFDRA